MGPILMLLVHGSGSLAVSRADLGSSQRAMLRSREECRSFLWSTRELSRAPALPGWGGCMMVEEGLDAWAWTLGPGKITSTTLACPTSPAWSISGRLRDTPLLYLTLDAVDGHAAAEFGIIFDGVCSVLFFCLALPLSIEGAAEAVHCNVDLETGCQKRGEPARKNWWPWCGDFNLHPRGYVILS